MFLPEKVEAYEVPLLKDKVILQKNNSKYFYKVYYQVQKKSNISD